VLQKCANPVCSGQFRYLHQGKLFEVEIQYCGSAPMSGQPERSNAKALIERWWLCDACAIYTSLRFDRHQGLVIVHSLEGWEQVVASAFQRSSERTVAEVSRVLIRPLDISSKMRRNATRRSKVQIRAAA